MPTFCRGCADGGAQTNLGPGYHRLWTAAALSTLGDGVFLVALPLLAATLSRDPLRVSLVFFSGWLPWLLFGLISGALVDRWDRRRVMWTVDAAQSLIPALVTRDTQRLERANSQLYGAQTVSQNFAGPPAGGFLFALAAWVPFLVDAVSFAASSALIALIRGNFAPERSVDVPRIGLWAEIAEGLRWLLGHRLLRTLAVMVGLMNLATMAGEAILVLFAQDELGLGSVGYGLLLAGFGAGGVLGSLVATRLSRHAGTATLLVGATLVMAAAWLVFGVGSNAWVGGAMLAIAGGTGVVFNVIGVSLRQAIVPDRLIGRLVSAFRMVAYGAVPAGAILGGVVGRALGVRAPFLLGAAVLA